LDPEIELSDMKSSDSESSSDSMDQHLDKEDEMKSISILKKYKN